MDSRCSVRFFSTDSVPLEAVAACVRVREVVEREEAYGYAKRMGAHWKQELQHIVGDLHKHGLAKPYLEEAPYVIVQFKRRQGLAPYSSESNGIAGGGTAPCGPG
ncbi:hypothetical protein WJX81_000547 [Elliptochloris bilobata]|uniref:FRIGIDA-like protein n=1 Tax=Elliptochloris bilobata TaxID=381761 RepID=A0AAW1RTK5_9CHLO